MIKNKLKMPPPWEWYLILIADIFQHFDPVRKFIFSEEVCKILLRAASMISSRELNVYF